MNGLEKLPDNLPRPVDDGQADHLQNMSVPRGILLQSTMGELVDLSEQEHQTVVFCYPMTGVPGQPLPANWDSIPGARGCTPELCSVSDNFNSFSSLNITVYGLSNQSHAYQKEAAERLRVPYQILSDEDMRLSKSLMLPTFQVGDKKFLKRLTLIIEAGRIAKTYYPVFPTDTHPRQVLTDLQPS